MIVIRRDTSMPPRLDRTAATTTSRSTTLKTERESPPAEFDADGLIVNTGAAVGEIVNTAPGYRLRGLLPERGSAATKVRHGIYWSGDLAYRDPEGWIYFAGRSNEWLRVDGENFAAGNGRSDHHAVSGRTIRRGLCSAGRSGRRPCDGRDRGRLTLDEFDADDFDAFLRATARPRSEVGTELRAVDFELRSTGAGSGRARGR